ncbi:hypothetical protein SUGI_1057100 [Cryptomeria japonica]|nr:hypothetical protein SUGI_1057100 [Cryptomeria japonica]
MAGNGKKKKASVRKEKRAAQKKSSQERRLKREQDLTHLTPTQLARQNTTALRSNRDYKFDLQNSFEDDDKWRDLGAPMPKVS